MKLVRNLLLVFLLLTLWTGISSASDDDDEVWQGIEKILKSLEYSGSTLSTRTVDEIIIKGRNDRSFKIQINDGEYFISEIDV